jgi:peptidoglycan hydrolase CwlO-like protein
MGRKEELYGYIAAANTEINSLTNEINKLTREINELNVTLGKVNTVLNNLDSTKSTSITNLELRDFLDNTKSEIADGFYTGLSDLLNGESFTSVSNGLADAVTAIQTLISNKQTRIQQCNNRITECRNNISSWQAEIDAIIAAERAAAEEEARRAAQQQSQG